jgi:hypothetical protein
MTAVVVIVGVDGVGVEDTMVAVVIVGADEEDDMVWKTQRFPSHQRLRNRTDLLGFVGDTVDTVNVGSCAPTCPLLI